MCGQTLALALARDGVRNTRIIDRAPRGREGPWGTYARMEILRSPKHLTGPDLGFPALTFRAWYEAQHGAEGWERLYKISTADWLAYLLWVRDTADIAVENGTEAMDIDPGKDFVRVDLRGVNGPETVYARKVVLAGGRDGVGRVLHAAVPVAGCRARSRQDARVPFLGRHRLCAFQGRQGRAFWAPAPRPSTMPRWLWRRARRRFACSRGAAPAANQQVEMDGVCGLPRGLLPARRSPALGDLYLHLLESDAAAARIGAALRPPCRLHDPLCRALARRGPRHRQRHGRHGQGAVPLRRRHPGDRLLGRPAAAAGARPHPRQGAAVGGPRRGRRRPRDIPMPPASPISAPASNSSSARQAWRRASRTSTASMPAPP